MVSDRLALVGAAGVALAVGAFFLRRRLSNSRRWNGWGKRGYTCMPHVSERSKRVAEEGKLRSTDVVIITFPKTGTTFLQQICEQLRTGGNMDFSEITERQPWLEFAWDCGQDLDEDHVAYPRLFKSHQLLSAINTGAKYLSVVREPGATLLSWFAFQKAKNRPPFKDCADANEYISTGHFGGHNIFGTNIWDFYVELWEAREDPSLLVLCYEMLVKRLREMLPVIADFLGVEVDGPKTETVLHMASKDFMIKHETQFDDNFIATKGRELGRAVRVMELAAKVSEGQKEVLSAASRQWLRQQWAEKVRPRTGLSSYEEMAAVFASGRR